MRTQVVRHLQHTLKGRVSLLTIVSVFLVLLGTGCSSPNAASNAACGGGSVSQTDVVAPENVDLFTAIQINSAGNNRLAVSLLIGSYLEAGWQSQPVPGGGAYGAFQIQDPGLAGGPNPNTTVEEAENPAFATNYMAPRYRNALATVESETPTLWLTDPERAAEQVAFLAERPARDYYDGRTPAVQTGFAAALTVLPQIGLTTDFSAGLSLGSNAPTAAVDPAVAELCAGGVNLAVANSEDAQQAALALLNAWGPGDRIYGNPGVQQDLIATSQGLTITNEDTCGNTISIDSRLLNILLSLITKYQVSLNNIATGHGCDRFMHPKGMAFDVQGATDLATGTSTNFCSGPNAGGCNTNGDNQELDKQFVEDLASILPPDAGLGQSDCYGREGANIPEGVVYFPDGCTHQHLQLQTNK